MSRRSADLLTALGLIGLLATVSLTAPRWSRVFREPVPAAPEAASPQEPAASPSPGGAEARRTIAVKLFFDSPDSPGLVMEEREVAFSSDLSRQIQTVVEELVRGPKPESGLVATLPPGTRVLDVFVTARGVAYVDVSRDAVLPPGGGSAAELRSVYSVVNSIAANFPAVRRVQILVDDRPAETLAGHVDLSRPLPPDMTLLAASTLTPQPPLGLGEGPP